MDLKSLNSDTWYSDLSQSQLSLWIGQELAPNQPLYNMILTFNIEGKIHISHFKSAFQKLINQSDSLRTIFESKNGRPIQKILKNFIYEIQFLDWTEKNNKDLEYKKWTQSKTQISFDLSKCLFESVLIKFSSNNYIWYLNQHHLITDGWGVSILYKHMAKLYNLALLGKLDEAPELPSFRDYLDYEKVVKNSPNRKDVKSYWKALLEKEVNTPRLYGASNSIPTTHSERIYLDLGIDRTQKLRTLASEKGIRSWTQHLSLFNIFLTTLYAFLYKVSGERLIAIGAPAHNRPTAKFKETIGLFMEVFPLISEVKEMDSFASLLQRVQIEVNGFLKNAQPGSVMPELNRRFNVILNYINAEFTDFNGSPMTSNWVHPGHCDPRHHLRLQVHDYDGSGSIQLGFDLNTNIFHQDLRNKVPKHFLSLLDAFIEDRTQEIDAIPIITQEEFQDILVKLNIDKATFTEEKSIIKKFENQVKRTPNLPAIEFKKSIYTYDELNKKANQLAHFLQSKNIGEKDKVAIYLDRTSSYIISILGVLKAGASFIPIPSHTPEKRLLYFLKDSQSKLIISSNSLVESMKLSVELIDTISFESKLNQFSEVNLNLNISLRSPAYLIYTSGSTGQPKGVLISHIALSNYIHWAKNYLSLEQPTIPLFTSIGFDLTITSTFLPLICGGKMIIYPETSRQNDIAILDVIESNQADFIKLTPSHLSLLQDKNLTESNIQTIVVGGENFTISLAKKIHNVFGKNIKIYNEYGPTEATVGCIVHLFDINNSKQLSVPIGQPIENMEAYILDKFNNPVPQGVIGELFLGGQNLAIEYWNREKLTSEKFIPNPFSPQEKIYQTGDLVRMNQNGNYEFIGRKDFQVKISGRRIELEEIEANISSHSKIKNCVVEVVERKIATPKEIHNCTRCGLPSNYPNVSFTDNGICQLCLSFENYQQKVEKYFKTEKDLKQIITKIQRTQKEEYDCIVLLSGGKDSSYALAQMVELGAKVLAFTLDNGYISEQAKTNIRRVVKTLGVNHVFGRTSAMNAIFVDSLHEFSNVCNGCFKTIYTLSIQLALEKKIPYIVTGLSRGQFFETRLTEELFWNDKINSEDIDQIILDARKSYHKTDDIVNRLLGTTSIFQSDDVFESVKFLDFYRYTDVSMEDMLSYLEKKLPWVRPTDTGRSTNCLINQVGIHVHKIKEGYSNYSFPYSWDVRVGHKTRVGALEEINEHINEKEVQRIMDEIGYNELNNYQSQKYLVAYYTAEEDLSFSEIQQELFEKLPSYMVPTHYRQLEEFPLSSNGKINRALIKELETSNVKQKNDYLPPETEIEKVIAEIWEEVLSLSDLSIQDDFLDIGGNSLTAIRVIARIRDTFDLDISVDKVFEYPSIMKFSKYLEKVIETLLKE